MECLVVIPLNLRNGTVMYDDNMSSNVLNPQAAVSCDVEFVCESGGDDDGCLAFHCEDI